MITDAIFSPDRRWRYLLTRRWIGGKGMVAFVGLNPSTADEYDDDPTIRRCINYAKLWGFEAYAMFNVFGYRSTQPRGLLDVADPVGPDNKRVFAECLPMCDRVICAWGVAHYAFTRLRGQEEKAKAWIEHAGHRLEALAMTKDGHPRHPLYLPAAAKPFPIDVLEDIPA